jgi:hypothetical protein
MIIDDLLVRLGDSAKPSSEGKWMARCPAHDDARRSLSIARGEKGIVVHCFAGCSPEQIVDGLGLKLSNLFDRPASEPGNHERIGDNDLPGLVAKYDYVDESGSLLFQVLRLVGKRFRQRRPDRQEPGGWAWNLKGVRRVPYRLPEVLKAPQDRTIHLVEGEKDVETLRTEGLLATTNPGGASSSSLWKTAPFRDAIRGRHVAIIPDNDDPGRAHALAAAKALTGVAASVKVLNLPGLPEKGDVSDWLQSGGSRAELERITQACAAEATKGHTEGGQVGGEDRVEKPRQTQRLVELAKKEIELFKTADDDAFARITRDGHQETQAIGSKQFRRYLIELFYRLEKQVPLANALNEAIATFDALAVIGGQIHQTHLRVCGEDDILYVDLASPTWQVVEISAVGWQVRDASNVPVRFRRPRAMLPFPMPTRGGNVEELRQFLNPGSDQNMKLLLAWLTFGFRHQGPFPVLVVQGEQGSAKSTVTAVLLALLDPSVSELRMTPKDVQDLMVAARNSWVLAYDNLSGMPPWLSDALCILSTGGTLTTRALYTADEETILRAIRPVIVNGIDDMTTRPDLADRAVMVSLPTIPPERRRDKSEFDAAFQAARPRLLGAVYSAIAAALRALPSVRLAARPRMADFATWGVALERGLKWPAGSFLEAYQCNLAESASAALEADPVAMAVLALIRHAGNPWEGAVSELLNELEKHVPPERRGRSWPRSPQSLTSKMRRAAPALRREGIAISQPPRSKRGALWIIHEVEGVPENSSPSSPAVQPESIPMVGGDEDEEKLLFQGAEHDGAVTNGGDVVPRQSEFVTFPIPSSRRDDVKGSEGDEHCFLSTLEKRGNEPPAGSKARGSEVPCFGRRGDDR